MEAVNHDERVMLLQEYRKKLSEHRELDDKVRECFCLMLVRLGLRKLEKDYQKTEDDIKALQTVGQIIGEVVKQLDDERCTF